MPTISKQAQTDYLNVISAFSEAKRMDETIPQCAQRLVAMAKAVEAGGGMRARIVPTPDGGVAPIANPLGGTPGESPNGASTSYVDVVLTEGPGPSGPFVELEDERGHGTAIGQWIKPEADGGVWRLRIQVAHDAARHLRDVQALQRQQSATDKAIAEVYKAGPWLLGRSDQTVPEMLERIKTWLSDDAQAMSVFLPFTVAADEGVTRDTFYKRLAGELDMYNRVRQAVIVLQEHRKPDEQLLDTARRVCGPNSGRVAKDALAALQALRDVERALGRYRDKDDQAEAIGVLAGRIAAEVDSWRAIEKLLIDACQEEESIIDCVRRLASEPVQSQDPLLANALTMAGNAGKHLAGIVADHVGAHPVEAVLTDADVIGGLSEAVTPSPAWDALTAQEKDGVMNDLRARGVAGASATDGACPGCGSLRAEQLQPDAAGNLPPTPPWSVRVHDYRVMVDGLNEREVLEHERDTVTMQARDLEVQLSMARERARQAEENVLQAQPPLYRAAIPGGDVVMQLPQPIRIEVVHRWAAPDDKGGG